MRSLQLLYTAGGNQAKLDARTESATRESGARPVLPKAPLVLKCATLQNLTLDEL